MYVTYVCMYVYVTSVFLYTWPRHSATSTSGLWHR